MRPAHRYTLSSDTTLRIDRMRSRCSATGILSAAASAPAASMQSYGF